MGDGILDASVPRRGEMLKPQDEGHAAWIARQKAAVDRTLDALEGDAPPRAIDIGSITIAGALGYLDFRFAAQPWRQAHPKLATWYEAFAQNPGIANTVPKDPADRRWSAALQHLRLIAYAPYARLCCDSCFAERCSLCWCVSRCWWSASH
jgi:glutathione S-transferase